VYIPFKLQILIKSSSKFVIIYACCILSIFIKAVIHILDGRTTSHHKKSVMAGKWPWITCSPLYTLWWLKQTTPYHIWQFIHQWLFMVAVASGNKWRREAENDIAQYSKMCWTRQLQDFIWCQAIPVQVKIMWQSNWVIRCSWTEMSEIFTLSWSHEMVRWSWMVNS